MTDSPAGGYLSAWVDFDRDGSWNLWDEAIATSEFLDAGRVHTLDFDVPRLLQPGTTYARFRVSTNGTDLPTGTELDGEVEDYRVVIAPSEDWGDAPLGFSTTAVEGGAVHHQSNVNGPLLGSLLDGESDGQPSTFADGDDRGGQDDDDGVTFVTPIIANGNSDSPAEILVDMTASPSDGWLNAWIGTDPQIGWNLQVFDDVWLTAGHVHRLAFTVPHSLPPGPAYARFRISSDDRLGYNGPASDGEVEDYRIWIGGQRDYGDAPVPYATVEADGGASHDLQNWAAAPRLGAAVDGEADGLRDENAQGDDALDWDDEDGVRFVTPLLPDTWASVEVDLTDSPAFGSLNAWIDFNGDGQWSMSSEQIFNDVHLAPGTVHTLDFQVPSGLTDKDTFARFRISSQDGLGPLGYAPDGEVEDYAVRIEPDVDRGDAPLQNVAIHGSPGQGPRLGMFVDGDSGWFPNAAADADDLDGFDDDDGITFTTPMIVGGQAEVRVDMTGSPVGGYLVGFIDYDQSDRWDATSESLFGGPIWLNAGMVHDLSFTVPPDAVPGTTYARFRMSTITAHVPGGGFPDGEVEDYLIRIDPPADFGDAPASYYTLQADNGASHGLQNWLLSPRLGPQVDGETDGAPSAAADGDDASGESDEDGVTFTSPLIPGFTATVDVDLTDSPALGRLDAWIDFSADGIWHPAEQIFQGLLLTPGAVHSLSFPVSSGAARGATTYARFRISTVGRLGPGGFANDGEVEDYKVQIGHTYDFGDAPTSYQTRLSEQGARHVLQPGGPLLGAVVDGEADGTPSGSADADDVGGFADEDGVTFLTPLNIGSTAQLQVDMTGSPADGYVSGWIDFNGDGSWSSGLEQIFSREYLEAGRAHTLDFDVSGQQAAGETYARFRVSSQPLQSFGEASDGEVEDYRVWINADFDFGDGPDWIRTTQSNNGARHQITPDGPWLGAHVDGETDGMATPDAAGDDLSVWDDEDGVTFTSPFVSERVATIEVDMTGSPRGGYFQGWFLYHEGTIFRESRVLPQPVFLSAGEVHELSFVVDILSLEDVDAYARFRISTDQFLSSYGTLSDGEVEDYAVRIFGTRSQDWGDAPVPYPTLASHNGAAHELMRDGPMLGAFIDGESNGLASGAADGDDTSGFDDDDGVRFITPLIAGTDARIEVDLTKSPAGGFLNAWIDFSRDLQWDSMDQIVDSTFLAAGKVHTLTFPVPFFVPENAGDTYARFRISTYSDVSPFGAQPNGEVEGYRVAIQPATDYGDAPFNTLNNDSGPYHDLTNWATAPRLGATVDGEPDGVPGLLAKGDDLATGDDEDGVTFLTPLVPGQPAAVRVDFSDSPADGLLSAWIDFAGAGDWSGADDRIFHDVPLTAGGVYTLPFFVPPGARPDVTTFARFRVSTGGGLAYDGTAADGEVEDYHVTIAAASPTMVVARTDPSAGGFTAYFNRVVDLAVLNLYDVEANVFGSPDVSVTGDTVGPIRGSLVVAHNRLRFHATGGPLPADDYTMVLRSGDNALKNMGTGEWLDGDGNGTPGGDFTTRFTIGPHEAIVVSLPDFSRGPEQQVRVPATNMGLPLTLSEAAGIESVRLTIDYDPALLTITGATVGPDAPAGATVNTILSFTGNVTLDFSSPTPLGAGVADFVMLQAEVPVAAPYGAAHVLDIHSVAVNHGSLAATPDDAIHTVAYLGDATGNGSYSGLDAQRVARVTVGLDGGFALFPMFDPVVVADATRNGALSALDAQRIAQVAVGLTPDEIPPLPGGGFVALRVADDGALRSAH